MNQVDYESLVKKLLEQKPELSRQEIENLIKEKKDRIGAGYLTNEGALFLIASDLGISLYKIPQTEKIIKKKEKEAEPSIDDLNRKYTNLKRDNRNNAIYKNVGSLLLFGAIIAVLILITQRPWEVNVYLVITIGVMVSFSIGTTISIKKARDLIPAKKDRIFLKFYDMCDKLQKFLDSPNDANNKAAQDNISELADYVVGWSNYSSPKAISELPDKIATNLRKKVLPLVKTKSISEIKDLRELLYRFTTSIYNNEPDTKSLKSFNYTLDLFPKITEVEQKVEGIFSQKPMLKPIVIGAIFWMIFFGILLTFNVEIGQALGFSVASAIGVITFLRHEFTKMPRR